MCRWTAFAAFCLLPGSILAADPVSTVKAAVDRGLSFLAKDALAWKDKRKCASCHHIPMALWSLSEAKTRGHAVDEKVLSDLTAWAVAKDDPAKIFPNRPKQKEKLVRFNALQLALGLGAAEPRTPAVRDGLKKCLTVVMEDQDADGSWHLGKGGRPPMVHSPEALTTLTLLALSAHGVPDLGPGKKEAQQKALQWLAVTKPEEDNQALSLRLVLGVRLGRPQKELAPLLEQLRKRQQADGGWGQERNLPSDAYATGQAIYALSHAGIKPDDAAVKKAHAFLMKTQRADGSWPMASQPAPPSAPPSKDLIPITYAGAAWATMGLVRTSPPVSRPTQPQRQDSPKP